MYVRIHTILVSLTSEVHPNTHTHILCRVISNYADSLLSGTSMYVCTYTET